jgi:hypothetical protein
MNRINKQKILAGNLCLDYLKYTKMKKILVLILIAVFAIRYADAQLLKNAKKLLDAGTKGITETEAADGIREALIKGTGESVKYVSALNGFWGNPEIRIPFPQEAKDMETKLRAIGLGKKVDEFNESMNRAAEKAAQDATPIFVAAIKGMTVKDAINIVKGQSNAATSYLQNKTTPELKIKFQPVIKTSLDNVSATKYWSNLVTTYNKIPLVRKMNPNLEEYVTDKAVSGLFIMIAREEAKIRKDPAARTSELLKKVFGN